MTPKRSILVFMVGAILVPTAATLAPAQTDFGRFPLTKAIPDDVFIAVAARGNPERAFLDKYWDEVFHAFMDSGILSDVWDLVTENMDDEQMEVVEDLHTRFTELCHEVDWSELFSNEMIWAGRFFSPGPQAFQFEGVMIGRMTEAKAKSNYKALKALMEEIVKFAESRGGEGALAVSEDKADGMTVASLSVSAVPGLKIASITQWKDTLVIGLGGAQIARDAVGLLKGKSEKKALVDTARFKAAFKQLPPAEDSLVFFDCSSMLDSMNGMVKMIEGATQMRAKAPRPVAKRPADRAADKDNDDGDEHDDEADEDGHDHDADDDEDGGGQLNGDAGYESAGPGPWLRLASRLLDDLSTFDYVAEVEWTEGYRVFTADVTPIRPGTEKRAFTRCLTSGQPVKDFARLIPREATTFSCNGGIDLPGLYDYIVGYVREFAPGGDALLEQWSTIQKDSLNLNIREDVCAVYTGPFMFMQMEGDWAIFIGVSDEEKAAKQIERLINLVREKVGQEQGLSLTPIKIGEAQFTQVSHPMMMMMGGLAPVVGCAEGNLVIGSSSKTVTKCLKTAAGEHPNITKSKQFGAEALMPKGGQLESISFTDERNFAQEIQGAIAGISMAMGFAAMGIQDMPPQGQAIFRAIPPMLAKLAPVAGKLDFYQSSASYTTFDGKAWHTRSVQNYKTPQERGDTESDAADDGVDSADAADRDDANADTEDDADEDDGSDD